MTTSTNIVLIHCDFRFDRMNKQEKYETNPQNYEVYVECTYIENFIIFLGHIRNLNFQSIQIVQFFHQLSDWDRFRHWNERNPLQKIVLKNSSHGQNTKALNWFFSLVSFAVVVVVARLDQTTKSMSEKKSVFFFIAKILRWLSE